MIVDTKLIQFAHNLADEASAISLKYYRSDNGEIEKDDQSPVTLADRQIEEKLRELIADQYPNHGVIGEEYDNTNVNSDYQWIIDPIDGTSSFIIGRPTFGNLIALSYQGKVVLGIINQPINKERWLGVDDQEENSGAWFNDKPINTRKCVNVEDAVISSTSPFFFGDDWDKFQELTKQAKYQKYGGVIYGGDCYSYALLASGFVDIVVEPNLQVYDYAALLPIVKAAGGMAGDWNCNELEMRSDVKFLACATPELFNKVCKIMRS